MELYACQKYQFARESGNSLLDLARHRFHSEINLPISHVDLPENRLSRASTRPLLRVNVFTPRSADIDRLNESPRRRRILIKHFCKTLCPRGRWI